MEYTTDIIQILKFIHQNLFLLENTDKMANEICIFRKRQYMHNHEIIDVHKIDMTIFLEINKTNCDEDDRFHDHDRFDILDKSTQCNNYQNLMAYENIRKKYETFTEIIECQLMRTVIYYSKIKRTKLLFIERLNRHCKKYVDKFWRIIHMKKIANNT